MKFLLFILPFTLLADTCRDATMKKSRMHPVTHEEISKEIENNLLIIDKCKEYRDVVREAELYNEYLLFKYLKLPTVHMSDDELIERCKRIKQ
mgnify:CR=1 FL=1